MTVPEYLPDQLRAGDTWKWTRSAPADFPATDWTLTYQFQGPSKFSIDATADGTDYAISKPATETIAVLPGVYRWFSYVDDGTDRYQQEAGSLTILPDLETVQAGYDARSHARRTLALIEDAIEKMATNPAFMVSVAGQSYTKENLPELYRMRQNYQREVADEDKANRIAQGQPAGGKKLFRFVQTS